MGLATKIKLPPPTYVGSTTLEEAIKKRRTSRKYSRDSLTLEQLSQLLWAAQGITGESGQRATPSAGALNPLHLYVIVGAVSNLSIGLYKYDVDQYSLDLVSNDDLRSSLCEAALDDQPWIRDAAVMIVITADFEKVKMHFQDQPPQGERGARYACIETGALAENVQLQATVLGLGVALVGGFDDGKVHGLLQIPARFWPTALLCIGKA